MEFVELLVRMDCNGCEKKVRKRLLKLKGIHSVETDLRLNKVTIIGYVDRRKLIKTLRKAGKRAEIWNESLNTIHSYPYWADDMNVNDSFRRVNHYNCSHLKSSCHAGSPVISQYSFKRSSNGERHGHAFYSDYELADDSCMGRSHQNCKSFRSPCHSASPVIRRYSSKRSNISEQQGYNYYNHMSNDQTMNVSYDGTTSRTDQSIFSEENPNACSIM
ncbi:hypothetical protein KP509_07G003100 [Ceratopteris richardii]|uniref:HMA domain-containing protein n=1 Tax=Ceratopteris richardii TaxID=49495 RepID=A0A8T2UBU6_CERRI|nr:hypothetical protein KP509_07G003100 [Ceratopteris richardii]